MAKIVVNGVEIEIPETSVEAVDTETDVRDDCEEVEFEESSRESYSKAGKSGAR